MLRWAKQNAVHRQIGIDCGVWAVKLHMPRYPVTHKQTAVNILTTLVPRPVWARDIWPGARCTLGVDAAEEWFVMGVFEPLPVWQLGVSDGVCTTRKSTFSIGLFGVGLKQTVFHLLIQINFKIIWLPHFSKSRDLLHLHPGKSP